MSSTHKKLVFDLCWILLKFLWFFESCCCFSVFDICSQYDDIAPNHAQIMQRSLAYSRLYLYQLSQKKKKKKNYN